MSHVRTAVKICGLTTLADARYAAGAGADFLGFVVHPDSLRAVAPEMVAAISEWVYGPQLVAVVVNPTAQAAEQLIARTGIDLLQLHGDESPEFCASVSVPVIKALRVTPESTPESLRADVERYADVCAHVLLDTARGASFGGTGTPFDWSVLGALGPEVSFFVAGGLNPENVGTLLEQVRPAGLDVSSGVESSPGVKDYALMDELIAAVRRREVLP